MTTIALYLLLAAGLILINAFFVLAEFALVKVRATRISQLVSEGNTRARLVQHFQFRMDEYLAVCQVGITLASIALGTVVEPAFARLFVHLTGASAGWAHSIAVLGSLILASSLHVVLGEQVPKMLAIQKPEDMSLLVAYPLRFSRFIFYLPLVVLNRATAAILRLFGISGKVKEEDHSEEELRIILAQSQNTGMMSFRRLLLLENIFDLAEVKVRDAMRGRDGAKVLKIGASWEENFKVIRDSRVSRLPLLDGADFPLGVVHIKDLFYEGPEKMASVDLKKIARPYLTIPEDMALETLLGELQRQRMHLAVVKNAEGKWSGIITLEDIIEEVVGAIEDEFEIEPPIFLVDALIPSRVVLGVEGASLEEAIGQAFGRVPSDQLPLPVERIVKAVLERERAMSTYLGNGIAIPHARLEGVDRPVLVFARSDQGIPINGREEKARLIFILLTPVGSPRVQVRLLARIGGLIVSEYVMERLRSVTSPAAVVDAIRAAEPMTQA